MYTLCIVEAQTECTVTKVISYQVLIMFFRVALRSLLQENRFDDRFFSFDLRSAKHMLGFTEHVVQIHDRYK